MYIIFNCFRVKHYDHLLLFTDWSFCVSKHLLFLMPVTIESSVINIFDMSFTFSIDHPSFHHLPFTVKF